MAETFTPTTISTFVNDTTAVNQVNGNFTAIQTAFTDVLSRSGVTPNQMGSNLDMNSNQVLNLPPPATINSPARLIDVVSNPTITVPPVGTSGATVPLLNANNTWSGTNTFSAAVTFNSSVTFTSITFPNPTTFINPVIFNNTGTVNNPFTLNSTLLDTSSVAGSPAKKYSPTFFGNAGTGIVHKFNRVFVGEATAGSADVPQSTKDWLESVLVNTISVGTLGVVDTIGELAIVCASRTSDFRTAFSSVSQGSQGLTCIGYNDDLGAGAPIAVGANTIGIRKSGNTGLTFGNQADMNNGGSVVDVFPFSGFGGGTNSSLLLTSGAYVPLAINNVSTALSVGQGRSGGPVFRKGILVLNGSLDTTVGLGTNGVAMELATGQSIRWVNSSNNSVGELYAVSPTNNIISAIGSLQSLAQSTVVAGGNSLAAFSMGNTSVGIFYGSGLPTISAPQGSLYLRTDGSSTSTRLYVNTNGSTTWTNFTSAA